MGKHLYCQTQHPGPAVVCTRWNFFRGDDDAMRAIAMVVVMGMMAVVIVMGQHGQWESDRPPLPYSTANKIYEHF